MNKIKQTISGHLSLQVSEISKEKIEEVLQKVSERYCKFVSSKASLNGHEQIVYIQEFPDLACKGTPICGYVLHLNQEDSGSFYQLTGVSDGVQIISEVLSQYLL